MSGHSKWKTIKHKKALTDAKRSKGFSKLIREIEVCARVGGGDPAGNATLRTLLEKAREINMPLDNAMRAIKKGTGEIAGEAYEAVVYEGYGPHNVAVIIDALTSNKNRTVSDLRHLFNMYSGNLGGSGSVSWMFERKGVINAENSKNLNEEQVLELLLEQPVDDIELSDNMIIIQTDPKALEAVKGELVKTGLKPTDAQVEWIAKNDVALDESKEATVLEFLDKLEDLDDIQNVYSNLA